MTRTVYFLAALAAATTIALSGVGMLGIAQTQSAGVSPADGKTASSQFSEISTADRAVIHHGRVTSIPEGFRNWTFLGAPLTPNGLNGGAAGFPEFHHVYIHPDALAEFRRTGVFPEGTTIVKELVLLHQGEYEDGSRDEPSGRGFFAERFAGIDMMVKDSTLFAETNGWGFFNFGHHEPPYAATASAAAPDNCASCHADNATTEMVFSRFYPILNDR